MTFRDKCSWIYKAKIAAPTFVFSKSGSANLMGAKWTLHYVEYNTNANYGMTMGTNSAANRADFFDTHTNFDRLSGRYYNTA